MQKIVQFDRGEQSYKVDLSTPLDISIPLQSGKQNPNCYYATPPSFETIKMDGFIGSVQAGGSCNYRKIAFTPHGNGTHTECYGHIAAHPEATIDRCLKNFWFLAVLITVTPTLQGNDGLITLEHFLEQMPEETVEAVVIRTLPNPTEKLQRQYSGSNPPYLAASIANWLVDRHVVHLLVDLPSVDKEVDGGALAFHKAFWQYPIATREEATITELIYVPDTVIDGLYLLNLQVANIQTDASPSRPVLYRLV
ncbi:MAG: cyclase family protein [Thermonemataceae bacterium]